MIDDHGSFDRRLCLFTTYVLAVAAHTGIVALHAAPPLAGLTKGSIVTMLAVVMMFRLVGFHVSLPFGKGSK
jgi:hypothetical protein